MARISLLLLIGSLLALAPSSLGQFGPQQHPCRCDKSWSFQLNQATICNWNTVDQYMMYMGQDVNFGTFPFGSCGMWYSGNMRCACTHIKIWEDDNAPEPTDHFLVYWMPQNVYFPPGSTLVWEWPKHSECQDPDKRPKPYPWQNWWQIQQLDGQNRMGPMYCVVGAQILPWTSWVPSPVYPPYQDFPQYTAAEPELSTASRSAQGRSARGPIDYNSTAVLERIHAQINARREQVDEAEAAFNALDSDDPRINKDFVRRMILARNLTRPTRH